MEYMDIGADNSRAICFPFEAVESGEFPYYSMDALSLMMHIRHEEKVLGMKRRWLMGLPTGSISSRIGLKRRKVPDFLDNKSQPESFLRDDDSFLDTVRASVQKSFEAFNAQGKHLFVDHWKLFNVDVEGPSSAQISMIAKAFPSILDDLNNRGLLRLGNIIRGDSLKHEKTRPRIISIINRYLLSTIRNPESLSQIRNLLKDPDNFQEKCIEVGNRPFRSCILAAEQILEELDGFPSQTLEAMRRKLKGLPSALTVDCKRLNGKSKGPLINRIQKACKDILSEIHEGEELPDKLRKAFVIAGLSAKQTRGYDYGLVTSLGKFPRDIEALHNDIIRAISTVQIVPIELLKDVYPLLCPNAKCSSHSIRASVKNLLIEHLFECTEMSYSESLVRVLSLINKNASVEPTKEEMEEEVECVLTLSSHLRQIVWDWSDYPKIDEEFADAYMDEEDNYEEEEEEESVFGDNYSLEYRYTGSPFRESAFEENGYLHIQDACDEASLLAYQLVGRLLEGLADSNGVELDASTRSYFRGGTSVPPAKSSAVRWSFSNVDVGASKLIKIVKELIPSFPESALQRVKESIGKLQ
ncbi:uncharacterized protein LOC18448746 [Amborella trichopoda]|nr:uncharacterized protein LOC18448746 [Amborella trichopoda]XP_020531999.1 uncharacterized protein LOC18448746 [Amborella trichopoda]XP_020532000.1 uncharacterized protein LOC18448746 [Amborella trichopoda]|eukprot:XP_006858869.2 uncharacterized protein LOC18448746 [Amborella trichopoda]